MSVLRAVQVGTTTAQAAIDAVDENGADADALLLRLGVIQLLGVHQQDLTAEGDEAFLLDAYRQWIDVAMRYYGPNPEATLREYARAAAVLSAELQIAVAEAPSPSGNGAAAAGSTGAGGAIGTGTAS